MARDDLPKVHDPELVDLRAPEVSRPALEALGEAVWGEALDWIFGTAMARPLDPEPYPVSRRRAFGVDGAPDPAPDAGEPWREVLREFRERIAPMTYAPQHPGAFGYFTPPPLPMSVAGEVLAQWTQQGVDVWHAGPGGAFVEEEVVSWLRDLVGMPEGSWGVLTSGGVMANLMALNVAREVHLRALLGGREPRGGALEGVRVYASDQTHFSVSRGLDVLGFPQGTLRVIVSDDGFRLRPEPVAAAIAEDRSAGLTPLAISAVAGSTNTGSVDDVPGLAALARDEGLWLHVDAAYGGAVRLSARDRDRVRGLELADSITIDPHKWFYQAYDVGALVVRRREDLLRTFSRSPEYYASSRPDDRPLNWYEYSVEGTRRFRALKLWMSWKHLGTRGLASLVERDDDLAAYFASRIRETDDLDLAVEPELSVVCFRHLPPGSEGWTGEALDDHQRGIQRALERDATAWVSVTTLRGRTYLRAGILNYLADRAQIDATIAAIRRLSEGVLEELDGR
ncbi:MAG TPA: aspartate aminotransferase family protein [Actinomycetota bacterium]|nr:aspartate aminotransferase family protein [Actinomycetota bacterium]